MSNQDNDLSIIEAKSLLGFKPNDNPNEKEIKKAFKNLAMQVHPDTNPGDDDPELFNRLIKAKDVLIQIEKTYLLPMGIGEMMSGNVYNGFKTICGECQGSGLLDKYTCDSCHGAGGKQINHDGLIMQDICDKCGGPGIIEIPCKLCDKGHKIFTDTLKIPAGTRPETIFSLGNGINIQVILKKERKNFNIVGNDIVGSILVPWTKMIFGGTHITKDPKNTPIEIDINSNSISGTLIRLHNKGFKGSNGERGDLVFKIYPIVPKQEEMQSTPLKLAMMALKKAGY